MNETTCASPRRLRVAALLFLASCATAAPAPADAPAVAEALAAAGANRAELESFLARCAGSGDAEKAAAARFLVANMPGKGYVVFGWKDAKGESVTFDALAYPNFKAAEAAFDALEKEHGSIDYVKARMVPDVETITSEHLVRHVDAAFAAWRASPAAERAPFPAFLDFVLPYRGSDEPICDWMTPLSARVAAFRAELGPSATPAALRGRLDAELSAEVKFDELYYLHPTDQSYEEMRRSHMGRCEDLSNLQTFAARAAGVATACDYTPAWAHRDNNHAWTVTLDAQGRGCEKANAHAAKVYRKTFSIQRDGLSFQMPAGREPASRWLASKCYVDVTDQYEPTTDVTVALDATAAGAETVAYLCVFNGGEWTPIHWGRVEDGRAAFTKMGRNHPYLACVHDGKTLVPVAPAMIVEKDGAVVPLAGVGAPTDVVAVAVDAGFVSADTKLATPTTHLSKGTKYALRRWDGKWNDVVEFVADEKPRTIEGLPADGLYWLVADGSKRLERVFTIEGGRQRWW